MRYHSPITMAKSHLVRRQEVLMVVVVVLLEMVEVVELAAVVVAVAAVAVEGREHCAR